MPKPQMYTSESVLEEFYYALANEDEAKLRRVHIPHSSVFYVREAIFQKTGIKYNLDRVERAMYLEDYLSAEEVFEPERKREYE